MARIRWHGTEFSAEFIRKLDNGNSVFRALEHGGRFTIGTEIEVKPTEVVSADPAPVPSAADSAAALQKAMDDERKTLPTVTELIAKRAEAPPDRPTEPPQTAAHPQPDEEDMSSRLAEKLAAAAGAAQEVTTTMEARADAIIAQKAALDQRADQIFAQHEQVLADASSGLDAVESALRQLSNSLPGQGG